MNSKEHRNGSGDPGLQKALEMISFLQELGFGEVDLSSEEEIDRLYTKLEEYQKEVHGRPLDATELQHKIAACDAELTKIEAEITKREQEETSVGCS